MKVKLEIEIEVDVDENGCWIPTLEQSGVQQTKGGYRLIQVYAHRLSEMNFNGDIPEGNHVDHLCRVRSCMCPDHLEAVTPAENNYRGESPPAKNKRKKFCPQGHPYDAENTRWKQTKKGLVRVCRTCHRESVKKRNEARPKKGYASGDDHWTRRDGGLQGEAHGQAKLTENKVRKIRKKYDESGKTQAQLAEMFGVSTATINAICTRRSWAHVE